MKHLCPLLALLVLAGCGTATRNIHKVSFEEPVVLIANDDENATEYDAGLVNFCSVVKVSDNMYYLYYSAMAKEDKFNDWSQSICMAWSTDGFHYTRGIPEGAEAPYPGTNVIIKGLVEMDICIVDDAEYPFRMVASQKDPVTWNVATLYKSADGVNFEEITRLTEGRNDTQSSIINRGDSLKIYVRGWSDKKRRIVDMVTCDLDGKVLTPQRTMIEEPEELYTSAASDLDGRREILSPTMYDRETSQEELWCYIVDGDEYERIEFDTGKILSDKDLSMYVAPGLVTIGKDRYMVYGVRDSDHEHFNPKTTLSRLKMAKVVFE